MPSVHGDDKVGEAAERVQLRVKKEEIVHSLAFIESRTVT